jgi:hypothetical protein
VIAIILGAGVLLGGANVVADALIARLRSDEHARIDREWQITEAAWAAAEVPWNNPTLNHHYTVPSLARFGLPIELVFRGWAERQSELPLDGNRIRDFRRTRDSADIWVWACPAGAQSPVWVDP